MNAVVEYAFVFLGLVVGYNSGGYLGIFLFMASVVAGIRQFIQVRSPLIGKICIFNFGV